MSEIAVITGGTSGIGKATALCLRDAGYDVYELSRREQGVEGLHHIRCDITDEDQVRAAVAEIIGQAGRIDVLINNAGFGISGAVEFTDTAEAPAAAGREFLRHGADEQGRHPPHAPGGPGPHREPELCGGALPHSVPGVLFRRQGGGERVYHGPGQRAAALWHYRVRRTARRYSHGFTAARVKTMAGDDVYQGRIAGPSRGWSTTSRRVWTRPRPERLSPGWP